MLPLSAISNQFPLSRKLVGNQEINQPISSVFVLEQEEMSQLKYLQVIAPLNGNKTKKTFQPHLHNNFK